MADLFWLSDEQWVVVGRFMPVNQPGARRVDDRRIVPGIVHVFKSGCRWRDRPAAYGPHTTVYNRFNRWSRRGFWRAMLAALAAAGWVEETAALDSTYVEAHRSAHGGKGGRRRRPSAVRAAVGPPRSTCSPTSSAAPPSST
jgi:transposase